jgi:hypothetical protein
LNLAFFGVDEASYIAQKSWEQLEARLRDPLAIEKAGCGAWTPNGLSFIYRKFIEPEKPDANYQVVRATPFENGHIDPAYYQSLLNSYSANFARQEVYGEYLDVFSGRAYDGFSSQPFGNIWRKDGQNYDGFLPCVFREDRPLLWTLDFNLAPATSLLAQTVSYTPVPTNPFAARGPDSNIGGADKQLNIIDEIFANDINTEQHCQIFYDRITRNEKISALLKSGRKLRVIVYGDASGGASGERRHTSASESDYSIIQRFFNRHSQEFIFERRVPAGNPAVKDRVNAVNAMFCNYNGTRRLAVHERCKRVIQDCREHSWSMDGSGNQLPVLSTKKPDIGHISDALGYLVHFEFPIKGTIGYKPQFIG